MAEESRPVAIRIFRPFETEEEFLSQELDTLTRTTIVLLGTQPRPPGVILRFELLLASGEPLLRGEGRVIGHKDEAHAGLPGLTLRFTRLDPKSKALVDRAAAMKKPGDRSNDSLFPRPSQPPLEVASVPPLPRGRLSAPPVEVSERPPPPPVVASRRAAEPSVPPPDSIDIPIIEDEEAVRAHAETRNVPLVATRPSSPPLVPTEPPPASTTSPPPASTISPPPATMPPTATLAPPSASIPPTAPSPVRAPASIAPLAPAEAPSVSSLPPGSKSALLDRLRDRAKNLSPEAVAAIFVRR